ncbi:unnamed protein product [Symbiodinium necroappetens]|uniref:Uncharacterized protein n=1 Tax=Symbiodinium necroappetens TaxID=1628268 RepID=A0A812YXC6_9DINO|nr:unnamed protein product [Symbiodinium necroappetens]
MHSQSTLAGKPGDEARKEEGAETSGQSALTAFCAGRTDGTAFAFAAARAARAGRPASLNVRTDADFDAILQCSSAVRQASETAAIMGFGGNGKGWGGWGWAPPMMWFKGFGKGKGFGRRRGPRIEPEMKIWIGNLPEDATWKDLQTLGNTAGATRWVEVFRGKGKGTGMIAYKTAEEVAVAMQSLPGQTINGQPIQVDSWQKAPPAPPAFGLYFTECHFGCASGRDGPLPPGPVAPSAQKPERARRRRRSAPTDSQEVASRRVAPPTRRTAAKSAPAPPSGLAPTKDVLTVELTESASAMKRQWEMPAAQESKASRFPPNFVPRKMCTYMQNSGFCQKGDACTFAHSPQELAPGPGSQTASKATELEDLQEIDDLLAGEELGVRVPTEPQLMYREPAQELLGPGSLDAPRMFHGDIRPTALCKMWIQHPTYCAHGDGCTFAHGLAEMSADVQASLERIAFTGLLGTKAAVGDPGKGKGGKGKAQAVALYNSAANTAKGGHSGPTTSNGYSGHGHAQTSTASASRFEDSNFKPNKICSFWLKDPSLCLKGDACSFAHGVLELHPNSVETCGVSRFLHSGFKPRVMCKNIYAGNGCLKGLWCTFAHSPDEML